MSLQVILGVGNKRVDLTLVLGLDLLGLLHLGLVFVNGLIALGLGEHAVVLGGVNAALQLHDARGAVGSQVIDLFLNLVNIAVDRLEEFGLLFDRQNLTGYGRHVFHPLHLQILGTQTEQLFLVRLLGVDNARKVSVRHDANAVGDAENLGHL